MKVDWSGPGGWMVLTAFGVLVPLVCSAFQTRQAEYEAICDAACYPLAADESSFDRCTCDTRVVQPGSQDLTKAGIRAERRRLLAELRQEYD